MNAPIIITGVPRSGTSMTCGIIELSGAFGGKTCPPNINNKKGMFENTEIRNNIIKPYLRKCGADPMGQKDFPNILHLPPADGLKGQIEQVMLKEGYTEGPWYFKALKGCLIWPALTRAFPDAKWVIIRRKDEQIIDSCLRTSFMRAHSTAQGWQTFVDYYKSRLEQIKIAANCYEFWSESVFEDLSEVKKLIDWLGLSWNEQAVKEFIDPALYKRGD